MPAASAQNARLRGQASGGRVTGIGRVLIVGGGVAGMSCAIQLRKLGTQVTLVDSDPAWKVYGAGITITGPTLRAFRDLGILEEVAIRGTVWDGLRLLDRDGRVVREMSFPSLGPGLPGNGGIMRPALHSIMSARVLAAGAQVKLGVTVEQLHDGPAGAEVRLTDGTSATHDLVIAADGLYSRLRERCFSHAVKPKFTGQTCWRIVLPRPANFARTEYYLAADAKVGFSPVSATHMYMFLLEHTPGNPWIPPEEQAERLHELMAGWGGNVPAARAQVLTDEVRATVNYRPLEAALQPAPWYSGRVVLVGDAAHATTPHLASGAGMAAEDGVVLAQEVERGGEVAAILERHVQRRYARCRTVVDSSLRLGEIEMTRGSAVEHADITARAMAALAQPI